jgi:hypothetical protein
VRKITPVNTKGKVKNSFLRGRIFSEKLQWKEVKKPRQYKWPGLYSFK